jgi:hypothetical protein
MMETPSIRVIHINADKQEITETNILDGADVLGCLQSLVGGWIESAGIIIPKAQPLADAVEDVRHYVLVDEEGLLKGTPYGFTIETSMGVMDLVGSGVITGTVDGETVSANITLEDVKARVHFFDVRGK